MLGDTIISITLLEVNIPFQFKMHSIEVKIITKDFDIPLSLPHHLQ